MPNEGNGPNLVLYVVYPFNPILPLPAKNNIFLYDILLGRNARIFYCLGPKNVSHKFSSKLLFLRKILKMSSFSPTGSKLDRSSVYFTFKGHISTDLTINDIAIFEVSYIPIIELGQDYKHNCWLKKHAWATNKLNKTTILTKY